MRWTKWHTVAVSVAVWAAFLYYTFFIYQP